MASRRRSTRRRRREPIRRPPPVAPAPVGVASVERGHERVPDRAVVVDVSSLDHLRVDLWWSVGLMGALVIVLLAVWVALP